jgi:hypothetical protein
MPDIKSLLIAVAPFAPTTVRLLVNSNSRVFFQKLTRIQWNSLEN